MIAEIKERDMSDTNKITNSDFARRDFLKIGAVARDRVVIGKDVREVKLMAAALLGRAEHQCAALQEWLDVIEPPYSRAGDHAGEGPRILGRVLPTVHPSREYHLPDVADALGRMGPVLGPA